MQQRSLETRSRIMSAAVQLFASQGYNASGVAEICAAAGISKGAFYHHFSSKQMLFLAVLEEWLIGLNADIERLGGLSGSVMQNLLAMTPVIHNVFSQAEGQLPMFLEFWVQAARNPEIEALVIAPYRRYRQFFAGIIQQGIDQGEFEDMDAEEAAGTLVSLAVGYIIQGLGDPQVADWDSQAQRSLENLIRSWEGRAG